MSIWDVHQGMETLSDKPRPASFAEREFYLRWLAERDGVYVPGDACFGDDGIRESDGARALIVAMPRLAPGPVATLDYLDEAGEVIRTVPLPTDKAGRIPMDAKAVRKVSGIAPVKAARKPVQRIAAPEAPQEGDEALAALLARVAALEEAIARMPSVTALGYGASVSIAAPGNDNVQVKHRSASERRAIQRAWDMRAAMRARADLDRRALIAANADNAMRRDMLDDARATLEAEKSAHLVTQRALAADAAELEALKGAHAQEQDRADEAAHYERIAEERALNAESRAFRMVRAASGYRTSLHRARDDVRGARAEARALARRMDEMRNPPRPAPAPLSTMGAAFAAATA